MSKPRRNFTAEQKADVVRRHLRDKVAISDLAAELEVQPTLIYQWVATVLGQAEKAFQAKPGRQSKSPEAKLEQAKNQQIKRLQEKLQLKNEVISELMEENVKAKKDNGDL
jgi:transposase